MKADRMQSDAPYTPILYRKQLCSELRRGRARFVDDGEIIAERLCSGCSHWWPADSDFFNASKDGLHSRCRACMAEARAARKQPDPAVDSGFEIARPIHKRIPLNITRLELRRIVGETSSQHLRNVAQTSLKYQHEAIRRQQQ